MTEKKSGSFTEGIEFWAVFICWKILKIWRSSRLKMLVLTVGCVPKISYVHLVAEQISMLPFLIITLDFNIARTILQNVCKMYKLRCFTKLNKLWKSSQFNESYFKDMRTSVSSLRQMPCILIFLQISRIENRLANYTLWV